MKTTLLFLVMIQGWCTIGLTQSLTDSLCDAAYAVNLKKAQAALSAGANPNCDCYTSYESRKLISYIPIVNSFVRNKTRTVTEKASPLNIAVELENLPLVQLLVENKANIDLEVSDDKPLLTAISKQNKAITTYLADQGADLSDGSFVYEAVSLRNTDLTKYLIGKGAATSSGSVRRGSNYSALVIAYERKDQELFDLLLKSGSVITETDQTYKSILHLAVGRNDNEMVQKILATNFDVNTLLGGDVYKENGAWHNGGLAPLHAAIVSNRPEMVELLLQHGADINQPDGWKDTPLNLAVKKNNMKIISMLLDNGAIIDNNEYVYSATENDDFALVKLLVSKGGSAKAWNGKSALVLAFKMKRYDIFSYLLEHGAALTEEGFHEGNLWKVVIDQENAIQAQRLLDLGLNINTKDNYGNTAMHHAVKEGSTKMIKWLSDHGADYQLENKQGYSPFEEAVNKTNKAVVNYMLTLKMNSEVIKLNIFPSWNCTESYINYLADKKLTQYVDFSGYISPRPFTSSDKESANTVISTVISQKNYTTTRPYLCLAYSAKNDHVLKLFLEKNIAINNADNDGNTLLHHCALDKNTTWLEPLLQKKADVNLQNKKGDTPLHIAIRNSAKEMTTRLLDYGCDINLENAAFDTPLNEAIAKREMEIARQLMAKNGKFGSGGNKTAMISLIEMKNMNLMEQIIDFNLLPDIYSEKSSLLILAVHSGSKALIEKLIQKQVDVNRTVNGETAFSEAIQLGNTDLAMLLLNSGATTDFKNEKGNTALHLVLRQKGLSESSVGELSAKLMEVQQSIDVQNNDKQTPLSLAIINSYLETATLLLPSFSDLNKLVTNGGQTYLHLALQNGQWELAEKLVEQGADPKVLNNAGKNCLKYAKTYCAPKELRKRMKKG